MGVWAQSHPGAIFGVRDPAVCPSRKAPAQGAPSVEQARTYFRCDTELLNGALYLVADVKIEVAPTPRPFNPLTDTTGIIDPRQPIYNIRGSFTKFACTSPSAGSGRSTRELRPAIGGNCNRSEVTNATGMCYRDTFADWHCAMGGQSSQPTPGQPPKE